MYAAGRVKVKSDNSERVATVAPVPAYSSWEWQLHMSLRLVNAWLYDTLSPYQPFCVDQLHFILCNEQATFQTLEEFNRWLSSRNPQIWEIWCVAAQLPTACTEVWSIVGFTLWLLRGLCETRLHGVTSHPRCQCPPVSWIPNQLLIVSCLLLDSLNHTLLFHNHHRARFSIQGSIQTGYSGFSSNLSPDEVCTQIFNWCRWCHVTQHQLVFPFSHHLIDVLKFLTRIQTHHVHYK